jgi:addiction module HigA family antidote
MGMQAMSRSSTTTDAGHDGELSNPHPGVILKEQFLHEMRLSQNQLAQAIGVPGNRIHAIVNGTRSVTADTDLRLCRFFGLSEGYFLRLQNAFDTLEAKRRFGNHIARIKRYERRQAADAPD